MFDYRAVNRNGLLQGLHIWRNCASTQVTCDKLSREVMPKLPSWYVRVPEILAQLRSPETPPVLDRSTIEELFGLRRRQAIRVLGGLQGFQIGKTFVIERQVVVEFLEGLENSGIAPEARARKRRVAEAIQEVAARAAARQVEVHAAPEAFRRTAANLPAGIEVVAPGKLQISYQGAEELLAHIVELVTAASNDFAAFQKLCEGPG